MNTDEKYIRRCIALAKNGLGTTYPNPLVGSVIVHKDKIIGEGWHKKAGLPHAEVNAVNSVSNKSLLGEATLYVNLEPCSHFGKTPPCCDFIVANGIPKVVIGTCDPNIKVAGKGIARLLAAGIQVRTEILTDECLELNRRFFTFHQKKRPYIILKWAESKDGFMAPAATAERQPFYITNKYSRQLVHKWRSEEQAILVGTNTAIADNPKLDVRDWQGTNPVRVVIDRANSIPRVSHIFDNQSKTVIICEQKAENDKENLIFEITEFGSDLPLQILEILHRHEIVSVIIEGGRHTLQGFIDSDLWDEARIFVSDLLLNNGIARPEIGRLHLIKEQFAGDELLTIRNHD